MKIPSWFNLWSGMSTNCKCMGCRVGNPCVVEAYVTGRQNVFNIKSSNRSLGLRCDECGLPRANGSTKHCRACYTIKIKGNPKPKPTCTRCGKEKDNKGGLCQECYKASLKESRYQDKPAKAPRPATVHPVTWVSKVAPKPLPVPRPYESVMVGPPPAARAVKARWNVNHLFFDDPSPGKMALRDTL